MRQFGNYEFPTPGNKDECDAWRPIRTYCALNRDVLVAATTRIEGTWKAYCAAVPGQNHDLEFEEVLREGATIPEQLALLLFPRFTGIPYAR